MKKEMAPELYRVSQTPWWSVEENGEQEEEGGDEMERMVQSSVFLGPFVS